MNKPLDVRAIRKELGISQPELARQAGVHVTTVWRWEHGEAKPGGPARVLLERLQAEAAEQGAASEAAPGTH